MEFGNQNAIPFFDSPYAIGPYTGRYGGRGLGSRVAAYAQTPETDSSSWINSTHRLDSICAMPVYCDKSHDELRSEDYASNDKGGPQSNLSSTNDFCFPVPTSIDAVASKPFPSTSLKTPTLISGLQSSASRTSSSMSSGLPSFSSAPSFNSSMGNSGRSVPTNPFPQTTSGFFQFPPKPSFLQPSIVPHSPSSFFPFQPVSQQPPIETWFPKPVVGTTPDPFEQTYARVQQSKPVDFLHPRVTASASTMPVNFAEVAEKHCSDRTVDVAIPSHISLVNVKFLAKDNWSQNDGSKVTFGGCQRQAPSTSISFCIIPGKNQELNIHSTKQPMKSHMEKQTPFANWSPPNYYNGTASLLCPTGCRAQLQALNTPWLPFGQNSFSLAQPFGFTGSSSSSSARPTSIFSSDLSKMTISEDRGTLNISVPSNITLVRITFEPRNHSELDVSKIPFGHDKVLSLAAVSFSIYLEKTHELTISSTEQSSLTNGSTQNDQNGFHHVVEKDDASLAPPGEAKNQNANDIGNSRTAKFSFTAPDFEECINIESLMPKLQLSDYYTVPPIAKLAAKELDEPGFCSRVQDFVVGRDGYGSIKFYGETDVQQLDLNSIVEFKDREVVVYQDESNTPAIGKELNKPAEITLLNVKCTDKRTGKHYTEGPMVDKYEETLKKWSEEHGAEFESYDAVKGEWKFKVKHFNLH